MGRLLQRGAPFAAAVVAEAVVGRLCDAPIAAAIVAAALVGRLLLLLWLWLHLGDFGKRLFWIFGYGKW